jgi:teichuronic acid biosynthesis glycosyltransferase TuaG
VRNMSSSPRVSVVVPVYNAAGVIDATLGSILGQTEPSLEVIVVDDRSTDGTAERIQALAAVDQRVRYVLLPKNSGGPATPRNEGVALSTAQWIAFCDSDDLWHPEKLRSQLLEAERHGADFVCSQILDFDNECEIKPTNFDLSNLPTTRIGLTQMLRKNRVATSSVMVRREVLQAVGGFDPDRRLIAVEDYDLWLRYLGTSKGRGILRVEIPLVNYRKAPSSLSSNKWKQAKKVWRVLDGHFARYPSSAKWIILPLLLMNYLSASVFLRVWRRSL